MPGPRFVSVGEAAKRFGVAPRVLTEFFYRRLFRDDLCPVVAGRRLIPQDYLTEIERVLRREGKLPQENANEEPGIL